MNELFRKVAQQIATATGSARAFGLAVVSVVLWAVSGPHYHYSDTWQLVINSGTSVATFLMVFLIQNTQNRDAKVMQLKLDELIRAVQSARTELVQMESLTDDELEKVRIGFQQLLERRAPTGKGTEKP